MGQIRRTVCRVVCVPIVIYQLLIRPILGPCCRFYPSCSEYALTAIQLHGVVKGLKLTICRLLRCHPWSDGGYDPVCLLSNKEKC